MNVDAPEVNPELQARLITGAMDTLYRSVESGKIVDALYTMVQLQVGLDAAKKNWITTALLGAIIAQRVSFLSGDWSQFTYMTPELLRDVWKVVLQRGLINAPTP